MKPRSLYLALGLVPTALCAPVPAVLVEGIETAPETSALAQALSRFHPKHSFFRSAPEVVGESAPSPAPFDNRPFTPTASDKPSDVLALPRPIATDYLLSATSDGKSHGSAAATPGSDADDSFTITEMEVTVGIPSQGMPCRRARLSRDRNDMLAVLLAVTFLAVVVMVETWASVCRSARYLFCRQGAIRLEEDSTRQLLSTGAATDDSMEGLGEKDDCEAKFR
ncbi:hypothetical protein B0T26DRAFT_281901 [Lasiosphaeria miniovina]|uniref:Transmembrane protein n=1 Tax=Lasiosphaeria miniovina TaxID=1954250 RepID=A0AA40DZD2_9PEZI|nr:uncharacterized protein B0T26DRAFT_281901 [Lasiosphaeria miniovina]KAK0717123.1 hypothetical protein B0T26DRAFT_281901 [Lasiosphaeria miniovina]